jgi:hypothetical protein
LLAVEFAEERRVLEKEKSCFSKIIRPSARLLYDDSG